MSPVQPPVLFHCLARLACVFAMCVLLNSGSTLGSQERTSGTGGREITGELQGGEATCGRGEASDRPLCWVGMDAQVPPGHRPNVRQSVHTHWKTALSFIGICHLCVYVHLPVCVYAPTGQMTHSRKRAEQGSRDRWGKCVCRCFCLAVWVHKLSSVTVNICCTVSQVCTIQHSTYCAPTSTLTQ